MNLEQFELEANGKIIIQTWDDYNTKPNIEYGNCVKQKLAILLDLINSLHEEKIGIPEWLVWVEPIIFKLIMHSNSFIQLFSGTTIETKNRKIMVFDEPTSIIMLRVIIENYLTFYYLYCDKITDEEKSFRVAVWKYSGLMQRNGFRTEMAQSKLKKENELLEINRLKEMISSSQFFSLFSESEKKQILKGIKPRQFKTWESLNEMCGFHKGLFKNLYGFKSNYTHTEFISILQINSLGYGFNLEAKENYNLFLLHTLISKCIVDIAELFPTVKNNFLKLDDSLRLEIQYLNKLTLVN